jgi:methionine-rich copper-binding protein CopC
MKVQRRHTLSWPLASLAVLVILALSATLVLAHNTTVTQSDPGDGATVNKSPAQVVAQFGEELVTKSSTMKVVKAGGAQVSDGSGRVDLNDPDHKTTMATIILKPLADGTYTVQWQALLTDGDASAGTFGITVNSGSLPAQAAATATATVAPAAMPPTALACWTPEPACSGARSSRLRSSSSGSRSWSSSR